MFHVLAQIRKWLVGGVCLLLAIVAISYWVARSRIKPVLHNIPQKLGLDIQQTSEGFSLSKSEGGRTLYTIRASRAVQFKRGGHATLRNVHIVVYGRHHDRYDQIYGDEFTYNPETGDVNAVGEVQIDLEKNSQGPNRPDQAMPEEITNPLHLVTRALTFNQKTGTAHTDDLVSFQTEQATGSAKGAYYDANQSELQLKSDIHIVTRGEHAATITGTSGTVQKEPRQAVLMGARIDQPDRTLTADKLTLLFSPDNTVHHAVAEGNVHIQGRGASVTDVTGPRGDLDMGPENTISQAIISGGATFETHGSTVAHGSADKLVVDFEGKSQASRLHMVKNARLRQDPSPSNSGRATAKAAPQSSGQPMEIAADQLDFQLENGNQITTADTLGKASITILPAPAGAKTAKSGGANATTVATAGKFHATFAKDNRLQTLQGWPDARIVSSTPGEADKVSTADKLDVTFAPDGGVQKLIQSGNFAYHEPPPNPSTGARAAFADRATYTPDDQMLVLSGAPRIVDGGMTTTATHIRMNRQTGEGTAEGAVKTTYSELKPRPDGALLATSDPIHVTAQHMNAYKQPGAAHYTGNVRLWQGANVVRAPKMDFDNEKRAIIAESDAAQKVSSLFVQQSQDGKFTPIDVTADKLTYVDEQRRARYSGNVVARASTGTLTADQLDVFLKASDPSEKPAQRNVPALPNGDAPSRLDHMVATGKVIVTEPNRRAVGDRLVYTADDAKYVLTGKSPSIFDAEHGTVWGDSLTFFSRDDRVLVESNRSAPTITRARTSK